MSSYSLPNQSITNIVGYLPNSSLIGSYTAIDSNNGLTRTYTYDGLQRVTSVSTQLNDGGTLQESYTYVSNGNRTSSLVSSHTVGNTAYIYLYDALGNITRIYEEGVLRRAYTYDSLGQLISETIYPDTGSAYQYRYSYDKSGNITNVQYISGSTTQNKTYTYGNSTWGDLLTNYNGTTIAYEPAGNPLNWRNADTIEWYGRQMSMFSNTNGTVTYYTYNADGIRTEKQSCDINGSNAGTVKYTLDGNKIVAEQRGNTMLYYLYDDNGSVMGISYGNNTYTFAKNIQGDVIGIYSGGTLLAKYEYNAYGQIMSITNASGTDISNNATHIANINPFRYRGYYYDTETGFYYLQSRYYDPVVGRFLNADDVSAFVVEQGSLLQYNPFIYCLNDPISRADENGMWSWPKWVKKAVAAVAVVATVAVVAAVTVATAGTGTVVACAAMGAAKGAAVGMVTGAVTGAAEGAITHVATTGSLDGVGKAMLDGAADGALTGAVTGAITGGMNSPYCFTAGTVVLTVTGKRVIESIEAGDLVWAWDEATGDVALKEVIETYENETTELVHVFVNGDEIISTPAHPFYLPDEGWTTAEYLDPGDTVVLANGEYDTIDEVYHETLSEPVTVYNFNVEDYHTYYVGEDSVLVHNKCASAAGKAGEKASGIVKNTKKITIDGRTRIPDGLNLNSHLQEVKNVKYLSYTSQLKDYFQFASTNHIKMELFIRQTTELSGPLQRAIKESGVIIRYLPW